MVQLDEVERLLSKKRQNSLDNELEYQFYSKALEYLLGTDCMWCRHGKFCEELLPLFLFPPSTEAIKSFQMQMEAQLNKCINCVLFFHKGIDHWKSTNSSNLNPLALMELGNIIEEWNYSRIIRNLTEISGNLQNPTKLSYILVTLFEILSFPFLLANSTTKFKFESAISTLIKHKKMLKLKRFLPGIVACLFSDAADVQEWAIKSSSLLALDSHSEIFDQKLISEIYFPLNNFSYFSSVSPADGSLVQRPLLIGKNPLSYTKGLNALLIHFVKFIPMNFDNLISWLIHMVEYREVLLENIRCYLIVQNAQIEERIRKSYIIAILDYLETGPTDLFQFDVAAASSAGSLEASSIFSFNAGQIMSSFFLSISDSICLDKLGGYFFVDLQAAKVPETVRSNARFVCYQLFLSDLPGSRAALRKSIVRNLPLCIADFLNGKEEIKELSSRVTVTLMKYELEHLCKPYDSSFTLTKPLWDYISSLPYLLIPVALKCEMHDFYSRIYHISREYSEYILFFEESLAKFLKNISFSNVEGIFTASSTPAFLKFSVMSNAAIADSFLLFIKGLNINSREEFWENIFQIFPKESIQAAAELFLANGMFYSRNGIAFLLALAAYICKMQSVKSKYEFDLNVLWCFAIERFNFPLKYQEYLKVMIDLSMGLARKLLDESDRPSQSLSISTTLDYSIQSTLWIDPLMKVISFFLEQKNLETFPKLRALLLLGLKYWKAASVKITEDLYTKLKMVSTLADFVGNDSQVILDQVISLAKRSGLLQQKSKDLNEEKWNSFNKESVAKLVSIQTKLDLSKMTFVSGINFSDKPHTSNYKRVHEKIEDEEHSIKPSTKLQQMRSEFMKDMKASSSHSEAVIKPKRKVTSESEGESDQMKDFKNELIKENIKMKTGLMPEAVRTSRPVQLIDVPVQHSSVLRKEKMAKKSLNEAILTPNINRLHKEMLNWNLKLDSSMAMSNVPLTFRSYQEYFRVFEPLLFLECKAQIIRGIEENSKEQYPMQVVSITNVDDFHDVTFNCSKSTFDAFSDYDFARLELDHEKHRSSDKMHEDLHLMAIVTGMRTKYENSEIIVRLFLQSKLSKVVPFLREGVKWTAEKLCNLVTINREYQALSGMQHYSLSNFLFNPTLKLVPDSQIRGMVDKLCSLYKINASQAEAIAASCITTNPYILIQGPPGTGKTTTIVGIVGAFLSGKLQTNLIGTPGNSYENPVSKILICTPSNAAADEIISRLSQGIKNLDGRLLYPKMVRFGSAEIQDAAKPFSLEYLVEKQLQIPQNKPELKPDVGTIKKTFEDPKLKIRLRILRESEIIVSTLSGSGHDLLTKLECKFENVIIDEACQAVELSALIPLKYGCRRCVLIGDPNQLPPTVLSRAAQEYSYEQSLFQRIQKNNPESVMMLSVQYRMHPEIAMFPNRHFYSNRLQNGPNVLEYPNRPISDGFLLPYMFFDIRGIHSKKGNIHSKNSARSLLNMTEGNYAATLIRFISIKNPELIGNIGIISPYKEQVNAMKKRFKEIFGFSVLSKVEINTVDGFQGKEKDGIIVSCVRAKSDHGVGFLSDYRRMNVALTRARKFLYILGNADTLKSDSVWNSLISDAKSRRVFISHEHPFWNEANSYLSTNPFKEK